VGPVAVITVAFLIKVVRAGNALYVLGNGSAFGREVAPGPAEARLADGSGLAVDGAGAVAGCAAFAHPPAIGPTSSRNVNFSLYMKSGW
jgi:hypothetical protein